MKKIYFIIQVVLGVMFLSILVQCQEDDTNQKFVRPQNEKNTHPNDVYLRKHLLEPYGSSVKWRWNYRFIGPAEEASPIKAEYVIPVTKLLEYLWIGVYESEGEAGKEFMKELFPSELQYIGSLIYQMNGSTKLGYAEGGARISLLNLNSYNLKNRAWLTSSGSGILSTVHHEFTHIVHQNYGLPFGFKGISKYKGNGWINLPMGGEEAIRLGCVSNYGTLNEYEDFCEIISHFLVMTEANFEENFLKEIDCAEADSTEKIEACQAFNEGKRKIAKKLDLIISYYKDNFNIDLVAVRDSLQKRLDAVVENNKIPE